MVRRSIAAALLVGALVGSLVGCSARSDRGDPSSASPATSAPSPSWLAVLASSADPNDLDGLRADAVSTLGQDDVSHVVVSPGACFTGIPQRYGPLYVFGVSDATRPLVEDRLRALAREPAWLGPVTNTCLD
jgi:hypothetical protein